MERSDWVVEPLGEYVITISTTNMNVVNEEESRNNHDEPLETRLLITVNVCQSVVFYFIIISVEFTNCLFNTISGVVSKLKFDNTTPDRAWTFQRGSLLWAERGCIDEEEDGDQNALGIVSNWTDSDWEMYK